MSIRNPHVVSAPATHSQSLHALRLPDVIRLTGLSRSQIYRLEAAHQFPRRIALTARTTAWMAHEIEAWLSDRIALSRQVTQ